MTHRRFAAVTTLVALFACLVPSGVARADDTPEEVRYDGHRVVRAVVETEDQLDAMRAISPDCWCEGEGLGVNAWRIPPGNMAKLEASGIAYTVVIENVQTRVDAERARLAEGPGDGGWFSDFKNLAQINARMDELAAGSAQTEVIDIGLSLEGRAIRALRITGPGTYKPGVLYNATQHAREWIAPMTAMYIAETLINGYGSDPDITALLDAVEIFVIPVVNPDGYVYTWGPERYWRKNRRNNGNGTFGVDLNRNWAFGWGGGGSSGNSNSETYRGPAPFSEPETQVMRDFYNAHQNLVLSIDFHSFGEYVLWPFAYTNGGPNDEGQHAVVGNAMDDAIFDVHGHDYLEGPVFETLYQASGGSVDWTWGDQLVISYTIELRGNDFVIDPGQIIPTGEENLEAALTLAGYADDYAVPAEYRFPDGLPTTLEPGTPTTVAVRINQGTDGPINSASGRLYTRSGDSGGFVDTPLTYLGESDYEAMLPAVPCGLDLDFYFEIESMSGIAHTSPEKAPLTFYSATSIEETTAYAESFQTDTGWTVENLDLDAGPWERGVPAGDGSRGDPTADFDGSGACYLTGNQQGDSDVDGGPTRLISPALDLSATVDPSLTYARWFSNDDGDGDRLDVEISNDGGANWSLVESTGDTGGWAEYTVRVNDYVAPTANVVLRFSATDNPNNSVTEAAVDAIRVFETGCPGGLTGDATGDGVVDFQDILAVLGAWGPCGGCPEDLNDDGVVSFADLLVVLGNWS